MRVTADMIDQELRRAAILGRYVMQPWPWFFRLLARRSKRARGRGRSKAYAPQPGPATTV